MKKSLTKLALILCIPVLLLAGCEKEVSSTMTTSTAGTSGSTEQKTQLDYGFEKYTPPPVGEEIAVMTTSMGVIKIRFFPEAAPKAVENFKTHAKEGYYDGLIFHRVMDNFMIQGGDPTGTGRGGESIWGKEFADEFSTTAFNFRYSLSMANAGVNTNGSQFFINQCDTVPKSLIDQMKQLPELFPAKAVEIYQEYGGYPTLDNKHTVFGYVFEGMDVVDAIAEVKTDSNDKPVKDVKIDKLEIVAYS